jgi:hypothetical protein
MRIEVNARYHNKDSTAPIPQLIQYISAPGGEIVFRFKPDANDASDEERKAGLMERTLRVSIVCREDLLTIRKTRTFNFALRLDPEKIVRRVPSHLGKILGLTPKSMK